MSERPDINPLALSRPPIRATILTGFLGAGKTTLLNRYLATRPERKVAVLENESAAWASMAA